MLKRFYKAQPKFGFKLLAKKKAGLKSRLFLKNLFFKNHNVSLAH